MNHCDKRLSHIQPVSVCANKSLLTHITTRASEPFLNLLKQMLLTVTQAFSNTFPFELKWGTSKMSPGEQAKLLCSNLTFISFNYSATHECYKVLFIAVK